MYCNPDEPSPIKLRWDKSGAELYPSSANFTYDATKYDYFHCEFPLETANEIEKAAEIGHLNDTQTVTVNIYGEPIRKMYFKPEFLTLGSDGGRLELHDLHEHLQSGVVDYSPDSTTIHETYNKIYESRDDNDIFNGLDIRVKGSTSDEDGGLFSFTFPKHNNTFIDVDISYAINFQHISPLKAIKKANNQFGVHTHISPNGKLVVGEYNSNREFKASETGDANGFHIKNAGIKQTDKELKTLILEGPMAPISDSGSSPMITEERMESFFEWLNPSDKGKAGVRSKVYVTDPSVEEGKLERVKAHDIPMEKIQDVAVRKFLAYKKERQSGKAVLSGPTSEVRKVPRVGDRINIASPISCGLREGSSYPGGKYFVSGVNHVYDSSLDMKVDVKQIADVDELETRTVFIDSEDNQTYTHDELYGVDEFFDGLFK